MSKLTKKQQKVQEMLADFAQPATAVDALKNYRKYQKQHQNLTKQWNAT